MTRDLTYGKPLKLILQFGIPILLGFLFQQFYNMADTAIVGHFLGGNALAAVGCTGSVNFLVIGFCSGICNGFAIPIAQRFGARDYPDLRKYVSGSMWLCIFFGVVITTVTTVFCRDILTAMNTQPEVFEGANTYIFTIFAGIPTFFLYNMCAAILRSLGDSKTPVTWLITASLINIVLDLFCIVVLHMGVFGAAIATVTAQLISGVGCLIRVLKGFPEVLRSQSKGDSKATLSHFGKLCGMGLPMGLQYSITAIGSIVLQSAVNTLGTAYVTAVTAGSKLSMFLVCPFDAMGSTMATYGGQNVGAKKLDRLNEGLKSCVLLGLIYSVIAFAAILLFSRPMSKIFLDEDSMVLTPYVRQFLIAQGAFYFPLSLVNIVRFMIQGMGFSPIATVAGIFEMIARCLVAYLAGFWGFNAVCFASPAAWVLADLFLIPAYFLCRRKLYKKNNENQTMTAAENLRVQE